MSKIEKAMLIVGKFQGRLESRQIREKISTQCKMSPDMASTYYYMCKKRLAKPAAKAKKKAA